MRRPLKEQSVDAAMTATELLRIAVADADILRRMIESPLAPGIEGSSPDRHVTHDVYFDTPAGMLEGRGVTCRLRTSENGERSLAVIEHSLVDGVDATPDAITEGPIEHHATSETFEDSEPERRLRQFIDPSDIAPTHEVTTERIRRRAPHGLLRGATVECDFATVTVRVAGRSQAFHEAVVRRIAEPDAVGPLIVAEWATHHSALPATTPYSRIRRAAACLRRDANARMKGVEVRTVLIAAGEGRIACIREGDRIRLPSCSGSDHHAAARVAATCGLTAGDIARLPITPRMAGEVPVDVWVGTVPNRVAVPSAVTWLPLHDLLAHAGGPHMTDGPTLAALAVFTSSAAMDAVLESSSAWQAANSVDLGVAVRPETLNAELSLLDFNARVLTMAEDRAAALGDRLRMLAITCANADEFVMVRLPELRAKVGRDDPDPDDGLSPFDRFNAARARLAALRRSQSRCFVQCLESLAASGIRVRRWTDLAPADQRALGDWFADTIAPRIASDGMTLVLGHPFPRLPHLTLSLCVIGRHRGNAAWRLSQFDLPRDCGRFVGVPGTADLVPLEDVARHSAHALNPDLEIAAAYAFRVIRQGDLTLSEGDDLYGRVEDATRRRAYNRVAGVEVEPEMPGPVRDALLAALQVEPGIADNALETADAHAVPGPLALVDARELIALAPQRSLPAPKRSPAEPVVPLWAEIAAADRLMHHPYDSWDATVLRYFTSAASDPLVRSIRATLYRVGDESPVVDALLAAHAAGKSVAAYVELTARFDETRNLSWVKRLEMAGVPVAYGSGALKCHAKVALVERWEDGAIRRYAHVGTGNYNVTSARMYTDFSLLTADPRVTDDLHRFFDWLIAGASGRLRCDHCLVAPTGLLDGVLSRIDREIGQARAGRTARIRLKLNALSERDLVGALYRASGAGVEVELVVRGICTLRPGVRGLSDRIRVSSRIGRFLEHGRIYHFANGGDDEYLIGSADWRPRNMRRRIEVVTPVFDAVARERLATILDTEIADPAGWRLAANGTYVAPSPGGALTPDQRFALR